MVALMVILPGTRSDNSLLWRLCPEVRLQVRLVVLQLQYLAVYLYVYLYIYVYIYSENFTLCILIHAEGPMAGYTPNVDMYNVPSYTATL